jgi:hypothetical protein
VWVEVSKDRFSRESSFEFVEYLLAFSGPLEGNVLCQEVVEWFNDVRETVDEAPVEVGEA